MRLYEVLLSQRVIYLVVEYAARRIVQVLLQATCDVTTGVGHPAREQRAGTTSSNS